MKKLNLLFCCLLLSPFVGFSQRGEVDTSGYLFEQFVDGEAMMKDGSVESAAFNYDTKNQSIVFKQGKDIMTLTGLEKVDTIYVNNKKFVAVHDVVYEVVASAPVALLVTYVIKNTHLTTTTDHNGTSTKPTGVVNNTVSDFYVTRLFNPKYGYTITNQYWLKKGDRIYKANTEKQVINLFAGKSAEINNYIKSNKPNFNNTNDVIRLVKYCNTL